MADPRTELAELLRQLPGVGARQAARFAAYARFRDRSYAQRLSAAFAALHDGVRLCHACQCMHAERDDLCRVCRSQRDATLMVVANDIDKEAIERSGAYRGYYLVAGGTVPILDREPERRVRMSALRDRITALLASPQPLQEIVFAFAANPEGDNTEAFLRAAIEEWYPDEATRPHMTRLARGISTGTEIEYADPDTLEAALKRRG